MRAPASRRSFGEPQGELPDRVADTTLNPRANARICDRVVTVPNQNVPFTLERETFRTHCGRNDRPPVGSRLDQLQARAAASRDRIAHDSAITRKLLQILNDAGKFDTGRRRGECRLCQSHLRPDSRDETVGSVGIRRVLITAQKRTVGCRLCGSISGGTSIAFGMQVTSSPNLMLRRYEVSRRTSCGPISPHDIRLLLREHEATFARHTISYVCR